MVPPPAAAARSRASSETIISRMEAAPIAMPECGVDCGARRQVSACVQCSALPWPLSLGLWVWGQVINSSLADQRGMGMDMQPTTRGVFATTWRAANLNTWHQRHIPSTCNSRFGMVMRTDIRMDK
jgi:hypothetical protein